MVLDIKKYVKGICFLCNSPCDPEGYCHNECAIAYSEDEKKRRREAYDKEKA